MINLFFQFFYLLFIVNNFAVICENLLIAFL